MKILFSIKVVICLLMVWPIVASSALAHDSQASQQGGTVTGKNTIKDRRIITPEMNARERIEIQHNIKKRATARRKALIQKAEMERQQQEKSAVSPGSPGGQ